MICMFIKFQLEISFVKIMTKEKITALKMLVFDTFWTFDFVFFAKTFTNVIFVLNFDTHIKYL